MYEGPAFGACGSYPCEIDGDGTTYVLDFDGEIKQDDILKSEWTKEMHDHFAANRDAIYGTCTFPSGCNIDNKVVVPWEINPETDKIV